MPKQPSIVFLIPYFGAWPFWMPMFLRGCAANQTIDWLFFTDCGIPAEAPANVRFEEMSFAEYCDLVSARLGIRFAPDNPYKLCDIKPALGYVHADRLDGYDFWAFGDIDVVYGDLRRYFNAERLQSRDLFATHERRISGHLCLVRNNQKMLEAFKQIPRWQERYSDPEHHALDEGAFSRLFIRHKNWPEWARRIAARFNDWYQRSEFTEAHSTFTVMPDGTRVDPEVWYSDDGRLSNSTLGKAVELPYLHFMVWKNQQWKGRDPETLFAPDIANSPSWEVSAQGWRIAVAGDTRAGL